MSTFSPMPEKDYKTELKWLMFFRILFSVLMLGSTIVLQLGETTTLIEPPLLVLYGLIVTIFLISLVYGLLLKRVKKSISFAFIQVFIDTFFVTLIIFVTGGSLFGCYRLFEHVVTHAGYNGYCRPLQYPVWMFG
jgi:two-component system sensor histidine kinase HydH